MRGIDIYNVAIFLTPVVAVLCLLSMLVLHTQSRRTKNKGYDLILALYFVAVIGRFTSPLINYYLPEVFVYLNWLSYYIVLTMWVLLYHFIFSITRTDPDDRFPGIYYTIPVVIALAMAAATVFTPYDVQFEYIREQAVPQGHLLFVLLSDIKNPLVLAFSIYFVIRSFLRLMRYRELLLDYSAKDMSDSFTWLKIYMLLMLALPSLSIIGTLSTHQQIFSLPALTLPILLITFINVYLCYNILAGNYILIEEISPEYLDSVYLQKDDSQSPEMHPSSSDAMLSRRQMDRYMRHKKPYLDPELTINTLVKDLGINRSYISAFINREYGMNFRYYINSYRMEEYHALCERADNKERSRRELSALAGFGSYESFVRCIRREEGNGA